MSTHTPKHTPGPWNLSSNGDGRTYVEAESDGEDIACLLMDHDSQQNSANARLIRSAPELLEACRTALRRGHGEADGVLRAAIIKAGGIP